jgi:hypothetical protein
MDWDAMIPAPSSGEVHEYLEAVRDSGIVPIQGLRHVWFASGLLGEHLALLRVIATTPVLGLPGSRDAKS